MANSSVIQEYLVALSYAVNQPSLQKFNDALKSAANEVERLSGQMLSNIVKAGAAITTTLTGVAAGTVGLMEHVANSDLQFQIYARRMFMATDAAKQMKIALDTLGYSMEDVIFGPRELAGRFGRAIDIQKTLIGQLGGPEFEQQMMRIRDIRAEFSYLNIELQYLGMNLTKTLSVALFGDENSLLGGLQRFNKWFIENIPQISETLTKYLVPALRDTWKILVDIGDISKIGLSTAFKLLGDFYGDPKLKDGKVNLDNIGRALDHVAETTRKVFDALDKAANWINTHPILAKTFLGITVGAGTGAALGIVGGPAGMLTGTGWGALIGGVLGFGESVIDAIQDSSAYRQFRIHSMSKLQWQRYAQQVAAKYGLDPALLMGLIDKEDSGWDPYAVNPQSGAVGFGQFLPGNRNMYGMNAGDPVQNMDMTGHYLRDLLAKHGGDVRGALKDYGGFRTQDPSQYQDYILQHRDRYREAIGAGAFKPMSYSGGNVDIGGVTVHVTQPNASAHEIADVVVNRIDERMRRRTQEMLIQQQGVFA